MIYTTKDYNRISYINIYNNIVIADVTRMYCYDKYDDADEEVIKAITKLVANYQHDNRANLVYYDGTWRPIGDQDIDLLNFIDQCRRTLKGDYHV